MSARMEAVVIMRISAKVMQTQRSRAWEGVAALEQRVLRAILSRRVLRLEQLGTDMPERLRG